MYRAKSAKVPFAFYREELNPYSREGLFLESELRDAIARGGLELVFPPHPDLVSEPGEVGPHAKVALQPRQQIEIERRGHAGRIVVGGQQPAPVALQVGTDQQGVAGSAVRGDLPFAMIACSDIAQRAAERLTRRDFSGKQVDDLLGERDISLNEAIAVLGRRIGKPDLRYVQFPSAEAEKGLVTMGVGADAARLFIEMSQALNEGRFAVNRPRSAQNTTPTSIETFAEVFSAAYDAAAPHHAA